MILWVRPHTRPGSNPLWGCLWSSPVISKVSSFAAVHLIKTVWTPALIPWKQKFKCDASPPTTCWSELDHLGIIQASHWKAWDGLGQTASQTLWVPSRGNQEDSSVWSPQLFFFSSHSSFIHISGITFPNVLKQTRFEQVSWIFVIMLVFVSIAIVVSVEKC